jgi:glycerophosphoryl diester phosphodiesterase
VHHDPLVPSIPAPAGPAGHGFVIAHRGSSGRAPENTMLAFSLALGEDGAEGLELDLRCTRDGRVVVMHDATVDRTTNGRGRVDSFDLSDLRRLDAGFAFRGDAADTPFRGQGLVVPTLVEVLERFPGVWMSLDLKEGNPLLESATVALLRVHHASSHVVLSAESPESARRIARRAPEFVRFFDSASARDFYRRHLLRLWWGYRPPAHSLQIPVTWKGRALDTPRLLADAHRFGIAVRYWTINDEATMERLIERGADGIITDHPARLRAVLERKGLR